MKALRSFVFLIGISFLSPSAYAGYGGFSLSTPHYQRHILISYGFDLTTYLFLRSRKQKLQPSAWTAAGLTLGLGLVYALLQHSRDSTYSIGNDMLANTLGVAAASGAIFVIKF